jgi:hypothetical protein
MLKNTIETLEYDNSRELAESFAKLYSEIGSANAITKAAIGKYLADAVLEAEKTNRECVLKMDDVSNATFVTVLREEGNVSHVPTISDAKEFKEYCKMHGLDNWYKENTVLSLTDDAREELQTMTRSEDIPDGIFIIDSVRPPTVRYEQNAKQKERLEQSVSELKKIAAVLSGETVKLLDQLNA